MPEPLWTSAEIEAATGGKLCGEAFVATGSRFFSTRAIGDFYRIQRSMDPPQYFRLQFGNDFRVTTLLETVKSSCTMEVYEEPVKGGYYVLGADPAYADYRRKVRWEVIPLVY